MFTIQKASKQSFKVRHNRWQHFYFLILLKILHLEPTYSKQVSTDVALITWSVAAWLYCRCPSLPPIHPSHAAVTQHAGIKVKQKLDTVCVMWASVCAFATCAWWQLEAVTDQASHMRITYSADNLIGNWCVFSVFHRGEKNLSIP